MKAEKGAKIQKEGKPGEACKERDGTAKTTGKENTLGSSTVAASRVRLQAPGCEVMGAWLWGSAKTTGYGLGDRRVVALSTGTEARRGDRGSRIRDCLESELAQRSWQEGREKRDKDADLQSGGGRVISDRRV